MLKKCVAGALIRIEMQPGVGVPSTIVKKGIERATELGLATNSRKSKNSFEEKDQVWVVFDKDTHPKFDESVQQATAAGLGVARSNPCFEVWAILHYQDYDKACSSADVQRDLAGIDRVYRSNKKSLDCDCIVNSIEIAVDRANKQLDRRAKEGKAYCSPSTTFQHFVVEVFKAAKKFKM